MNYKKTLDEMKAEVDKISALSALINQPPPVAKPYSETALPGDVVQINDTFGEDRQGWIGAFVLVTEVREWGVIGFVHVIERHTEHGRAFIRIKWGAMDYIGQAILVPAPNEEIDE